MGLYRVNLSVAHSLSHNLNLKPVWLLGPKAKYTVQGLLAMSRINILGVNKKSVYEGIKETCGQRFFHASSGQCLHITQNNTVKWTGKKCLVAQNSCIVSPVRFQVSSRKRTTENTSKSITEAKDKPYAELTVGQKVKQAGKDATYTGIIILGVGVTGVMFYAIGRELFSGQSPSGVYGRAFKICKKNEELVIALGEPIKGYGEMTRRGRRRHVSHQEYEVDGFRHIRMKFYMEGPSNKGTVHLDARKSTKGKYEFRYIFVELENYPRRTIIVEDNR